jgi:hypothetical protein
MAKKPLTQMQQRFKEHMVRPIMCILFPEFADIMDEFQVSFGSQYSWVNIKAVRPAVYYGIDDRTKKERKDWSKPDPRELIEEKYSLEVGMDNHAQSTHKLSGHISRKFMEDNFDVVTFRCWSFIYSYGAKTKFSQAQIEAVWAYLKTQGIGLPSHDEFWSNYWSDY